MKHFAILLAVAASICLPANPVQAQRSDSPPQTRVSQGLDKAIGFLASRQYEFGGFPSDRCENVQMQGCVERPILFLAANIMVSLNGLDDERVRKMKSRAAKLFVEQQDSQGLWDFYVKKAQTPAYVREVAEFSTLYFPDLDDTSLIGYFLKTNGARFKSNAAKLQANRERGLYLTFAREMQPPPPHRGNIDPVVNAHTLMYLGADDQAVCKYINDAVAADAPSLYYQDKLLYYYLIARAYHNGVRCLAGSAAPIVRFVQGRLRRDGSFGSPLQSAAALNTLLYFERAEKPGQTVAYLLKQQRPDGSWPSAFFFGGPVLGYGSVELTTAVAIEALANYRRLTPR